MKPKHYPIFEHYEHTKDWLAGKAKLPSDCPYCGPGPEVASEV